ncbi:MAG: membrane protein insertion efficiency factor YidD [Burkholderiaceae bacterium]|jgi:putative membrane protein insertion efficiency factor|nr:membrane protein insertion efficiency factor YidD [Burkholderiaceae bacterium]
MIARILIVLVRVYRFVLSPWLGNACRFEPTCSVYAIQALQDHGAVVGGYLTLHRLCRCQPWCAGGCDPVPPAPLFGALRGKKLNKKSSP